MVLGRGGSFASLNVIVGNETDGSKLVQGPSPVIAINSSGGHASCSSDTATGVETRSMARQQRRQSPYGIRKSPTSPSRMISRQLQLLRFPSSPLAGKKRNSNAKSAFPNVSSVANACTPADAATAVFGEPPQLRSAAITSNAELRQPYQRPSSDIKPLVASARSVSHFNSGRPGQGTFEVQSERQQPRSSGLRKEFSRLETRLREHHGTCNGGAGALMPMLRDRPASFSAQTSQRVKAESDSYPGSFARRQKRAGDPLSAHGFLTIGPIAEGAFSRVMRAKQAGTGTEVAVKSWRLGGKGAKAAEQEGLMKAELEALERASASPHRNVANLLLRIDGQAGVVHAVLEYCAGGSLRRIMDKGPMLEATSTPILRQVCEALDYLHADCGISHRDIKPANLLFVDRSLETVKLCDFGFATCERDKNCNDSCGTLLYMAPELVRRVPYKGAPVDLWAIGAVAYEMLHGRPAFRASSIEQLNDRIRRAAHEPMERNRHGMKPMTTAMRAFINRSLVPNPNARAAASELLSTLDKAL